MKNSLRRTLKAATAATLTAGMLAFGVAAASAHVKVDPAQTAEGGYSQLTFSVPNESATAKTSKLEVKLPTDAPFTSVSVKPVDGWTVQVITSTLPKPITTAAGSTVTKAASSVVWTADAAHEIGPNEYQTFSLSVGTLPNAGTTVALPAVQTYTDGSVVNWDEKTVAGQAEPEHPAPSFVTTSKTDPAGATSTQSAAAQPVDSATGVWGIVLGAAGLVLGAVALIIALSIRRKATAK
ncbi:MAG TPA: YcnI family protein [Micrococcaceae bacterium]|jgi:uncharacterized protein YcnI|nr:YcnI family protein [Micrococcaceae bacterium]